MRERAPSAPATSSARCPARSAPQAHAPVGVDKEPIAAAIARHLHQGAHIQTSPLQEATPPDNHFDLVISNVPFGRIGVFDPAFVSVRGP